MDFATVALIVAGVGGGLATGLALGVMRGRQLLASSVTRSAYDELMQEKTTLATRLADATTTLATAQSERTTFHERAVHAEASNRALEQQLKQQQEQLREEFKNTASGLLEQIGGKFHTQSNEQITNLLNPMREKLGEFQKLVVDSFGTQGKEQHTLKSEIDKIILQTDSLTKALRGDVKAQGNWGEVMLERILEESGLRRDTDYVLQGVNMGLSNADGSRQQPDVIINLPDNKHIIVDSKVSLQSYERYCSEADELAQAVHLKEFLKSVKAHVNGLADKRYQDNEKLSTPDFVLLFMPIEGAYSLAMQKDTDLHSYAWGKRIVIVCPTTLFATLRTVASLWSIERQNKNALHIATEAGKMYDKFADFIKDMNGIGTRLTQLQSSYDDAFNKLSKGRGNLVGRAEKLKEYGAVPSKALPAQLTGSTIDADTELLES